MKFSTLVARSEERLNSLVAAGLAKVGWRPSVLGYHGLGSPTKVRLISRALMTSQIRQNPLEMWVEQFSRQTLDQWRVRNRKVASLAQELTAWLDEVSPAPTTQNDETGLDLADQGERGWRQFMAAPLADHPVLIRVGRLQKVVTTDRAGYVDTELVGHGLPAGWHVASLAALDKAAWMRGERRLRTSSPSLVPVRIIGRDEHTAVVSDIDDTVMVTWLPRPLLAAKNAFFTFVGQRQAVPGMAPFLSQVTAAAHSAPPGVPRPASPAQLGASGSGSPAQPAATPSGSAAAVPPGSRASMLDEASDGPVEPDPRTAGAKRAAVAYLSTGAWNVAPSLRHFLARMGFPSGMLLLTDWGPTQTGLFRSGGAHKRRELAWLRATFPWVKWVLVGDDGQKDPLIYAQFAHHYPGAVRAVFIRQLTAAQKVLSAGPIEAFEAPPAHAIPAPLDDLPADVPVFAAPDGFDLLKLARQWAKTSPDAGAASD